MKIVAITRTRDEEWNIIPFLKGHKDYVDSILIADGGSVDSTKERIAKYARGLPEGFVKLRDFTERVEFKDGVWHNPEGKHINFLIDWAMEEGADWIVFDDTDNWPNKALRLQARSLIEAAETQIIKAVRVYWWGTEGCFPGMSSSGYLDGGRMVYTQWTPCLWTWRADAGIRCRDEDVFQYAFTKDIEVMSCTNLMPPLCLNHHAWPDIETVERKHQHYIAIQPKTQYPPMFAGRMEPIPDWAREE